VPHPIHLTAGAIVLAGVCALAGVFPIPLPDGLDYAAHADCHDNTARARIDSGPRQWLAVGLKGEQHLAWPTMALSNGTSPAKTSTSSSATATVP